MAHVMAMARALAAAPAARCLLRLPRPHLAGCSSPLRWCGEHHWAHPAPCLSPTCHGEWLRIVCNNSVEDENVRSFGAPRLENAFGSSSKVGLAQGVNNLLGNSFGPLLPQMAGLHVHLALVSRSWICS